MNWNLIAFAAIVPTIVGLLVAIPFWRKRQSTFGSLIGTVVIFGTAVGLILREYVELDRITNACLDAGTPCFPTPSAFTRFAIYGFISLIEVFFLFYTSIVVEERIRSRDYDPEWR